MNDDNLVPLVIALVGATGLGGLVREVFTIVNKIRSGMSAKERDRKRDLVSERDYEYERADAEARNRRRLEEYAAKLRRTIVEANGSDVIPAWPNLEEIPDRHANEETTD